MKNFMMTDFLKENVLEIFNFLLERKPVPDFAEMLYGVNEVKNKILELISAELPVSVTLPLKGKPKCSILFSKIGKSDDQFFLLADSLEPKEAAKILEEAGYALFCFELDGIPYGFLSKFVSFRKDISTYIFSFPIRIFKVQRRSSYRLQITSGNMIYLEVKTVGKLNVYDISDISEEGVGFFTDNELICEKDFCEAALLFSDDLKFDVRIQIKRVVPNKIEAVNALFHVGAAFIELDMDKRDFIAGYIFDRQKQLLNTNHIKI